MKSHYRFHSLEDYLIGSHLSVDGAEDDGWGVHYPIKGREIEATVLFADIQGFSALTKDLNPVETLAFASHFATWMTTEAVGNGHGIVDKYIGDEVMIVFSREFGSEDPYLEAMQAAGRMCAHDAFGFCPRIGLASGRVMVGFIGTPLRYNCSVFGLPVTIAARCAAVERPRLAYTIVTPANEWACREITAAFPPRRYAGPDGSVMEQDQIWKAEQPRFVQVKNLPDIEIVELVRDTVWIPDQSPIEKAKEAARRAVRIGAQHVFRAGYRPDTR